MTDLARLATALAKTERDAQRLPWAGKHPWRAAVQVRSVEGVPAVDLHGLSIPLGEQAAWAAIGELGALQAGAVMFITGRGRHTGGISKLKEAVNLLVITEAREQGWSVSPRGPGRILVVADASRAPSAATGRLPLGFWAVVVLAILGAIAAVWNRL